MMRQTELVERVAGYIPDCDETLLNRAYVYAMHKHRHQKRASGDPYFSHPLEVASIVTDLRLDQDSVVAALLHDTIEDTDATRAEIEGMFGPSIGRLVEGLTKLQRMEVVSRKTRQGENLRKLLLAIAEDVRVLLVKLADRLHNMRTIQHMKPASRERIAQETMDIYAPLAGRMGMQQVREELEDLSFSALHPEAYSLVHKRLAEQSERSTKVIRQVERSLVDELEAAGLRALVKSRTKRPYSVFRKMEANRVAFEQLSDLIGFRIVVDEVAGCYRALGAVHTRWPAVMGRFKDYISTPKQNDYRSLHTTVVGPSRQRVELQIRTHAMDEIAEYGIAAHSLYKDGLYRADVEEEQPDAATSRAYAWLRRTVENLSDRDHPDDILEQTRLDLFLDQVFCFTPKGRLIALPQGATAIDFAYAVHTDVGNACVGCRINGRAAQPVTQLNNGDEVHIITAADHVPPAAWEHVVRTGRARTGIRRATRAARTRQYADLGRKVIDTHFRRAGKRFEEDALRAVLPKLAHTSLDEALAAIGRNELALDDVLRAVHPDYKAKRSVISARPGGDGWFNLPGLSNLMFRVPGRRRERYEEYARDVANSIAVTGEDRGGPVRFAPGTSPVPGDRIVGILTKGEGLTIYPIDSEALLAFEEEAERWIDVSWDIDPDNPDRFLGVIETLVVDSPGTLAEITHAIAREDGNIRKVDLAEPDGSLTRMVFGIQVWDVTHLNRILRAIRALPVVSQASRRTG